MAEMSGNGREIKNFRWANDVPTFSLRRHGAASNAAIEPYEASDGGNERKWSGNKKFQRANDVPTFSLRRHGAASNTAIDTNEPHEASDGGNERKWSGN